MLIGNRYHATAVEAGSHLVQCMVYIDLNMVRAGVVKHPVEYPFSGYNEIQNPRQRYGLIDHKSLMELLDLSTMEALKESYSTWVEESVAEGLKRRQPRWTESIAVGSEGFVQRTKDALGVKAIGRDVIREDGIYQLREAEIPYGANLGSGNDDLSSPNTYLWDISDEISIS